jgi:hypothetical protein
MSTVSRTTSRCCAARPAVRSCFTAVIGVLLLAVLTNTAAAHEGDRWPEHGSARIAGTDRGGPGHGRLVSHRQRAVHEYNRGYEAGRSSGWRAGYNDASYGRRCNPVAYGGAKGRSHNFRRGYFRGYTDAYDRGYRQGRRMRAPYHRGHRARPGWSNRSVHIRWHF